MTTGYTPSTVLARLSRAIGQLTILELSRVGVCVCVCLRAGACVRVRMQELLHASIAIGNPTAVQSAHAASVRL